MGDLLFRNRRLLVLAVLLVVATGAFALVRLPRQEDPVIKTRFAMIQTRLPGASAERVEALVTERVEGEMREMPEVKEIQSTSRAGFSSVMVELREDLDDLDPVWSRVRDRLRELEPSFPPGTTSPELLDRELLDTFTLIAALRWRGGTPNDAILRRLAEDLRDSLRDVRGTGFVEIFGAPAEEIRVDLDRHAVARLALSPAAIAARIRGRDAKVAAGSVRGVQGTYQIEVSGELDSLERIRNLVLGAGPSGETVRLRDVAALEKAVQDPPTELARVDGLEGVLVAARMQDDERTDLWAARVREALAAYRAGLPSTLELEVIFDQSRYVQERLNGLLSTFLYGFLLVLGVTFLLMGWRAALVVGATLPLSSLMVFAGLYALSIPIQQMSVMGLIVALGMLIDTAIIMSDEVGHLLRQGVAARDAIRRSVRHLAMPLLGSTLTTAIAFLPVVLVPGATGEFISSIGVSVILAIASSLLLSMTFVPALVAILGKGTRGESFLTAGLAPGLLARPYRALLRWTIRHPVVAMVFAVSLPLAGFASASKLKVQFFPPAERDQVRVTVELPAQASIDQTCALVQEIETVLRQDDEVERVYWLVGRNAPKFYYNMMSGRQESPDFAEALVDLRTSTKALGRIRALQERLDAEFPQALVLVWPLEQGPPYNAPIELEIYGPDLVELQRLGEEARRILANVPDVTHTKASLGGSRPKVHVVLDEPSLTRTGLANTDVAAQLYTSLEGAAGGSLLEGTEELPVRVRLQARDRKGLDDLASLDLITRDGDRARAVPLSAVGRPVIEPEEGGITRRDGRRVNRVQGYVTAGILPSVVLARYESALERAGFAVPDGYRLSFSGEQETRDEAVTDLMGSVAVLLILMVTVLVISFGSFRVSALVLTIGVLSVGLGLLALLVFGHNFGFMAIVGTMGLMGLAINDSIAVLAGLRADADVAAGGVEATEQVVFRSTRHVLATTVTTVAGFLPLILAGGQFWPPLAISIAGGVGGATVLALLFLPAAYRALVVRKGVTCRADFSRRAA